MKLDDDIHNYYEHLVLQRVTELGLDSTKSPDYLADLCCLALNQVPPRYIRYEVDMALNSENALCLIRENHYDVLIITSDLPDMTAKRLCENLEHQLVNNRPLILVGAREEDTWLDSSKAAERLDVPVSLRWIVARLSEAFGDYT